MGEKTNEKGGKKRAASSRMQGMPGKRGKPKPLPVITGWQFLGEPTNKKLNCRLPDGQYRVVIRSCYEAVVNDGVVLKPGDQVLVASESRPEPFVAMITDIYICPITGSKNARVFWFYGQEILSNCQRSLHKRELVASKHSDDIELNCVEDKCFVLTYSQFCRYIGLQRHDQPSSLWTRESRPVPLVSRDMVDGDTDPDTVYWCHKVVDLHKKKVLKNPH